MRKNIFLLILLATQINFAQNTFPTTGNVGIGTTAPAAKLDIRRNGTDGLVAIFGSDVTNADIGRKNFIEFRDKDADVYPNILSRYARLGTITEGAWGENKSIYFETGGNERFRIKYDGNIGVGVSNPLNKLEVNGSIALPYGQKIKALGYTYDSLFETGWDTGIGHDFLKIYTAGTGSSNAIPKITILDNSNVGIGTTNPKNKLDVNGTIHSKEVKVDMNGWSDFVFKKEYS